MKSLQETVDAIIEMDGVGLVTMWTPKSAEMFGWSSEEALGKKLGDLIVPPKYRAAHAKGLKHFCATGEGPFLNKRIELVALRRNGEEFPVELSVIQVKKGKAPVFSAVIRDITQSKRNEQELKERTEKLQRFKNVTIGRELEMVKLKEEVNALLKKLGQPEKYKTPNRDTGGIL